jgi:hypothetical protein
MLLAVMGCDKQAGIDPPNIGSHCHPASSWQYIDLADALLME